MIRIVLFIALGFSFSAIGQDVFDAARTGNIEQLQRIANEDPDSLEAVSSTGFTPLILAIYRNQPDAAKFLLEQGVDANFGSPEGTAMHAACFKGDDKMAVLLVEYSADLNLLSPRGTPALVYAVQSKNLTLIRFLVGEGADTSLTDEYGKTALDYALTLGLVEVVHILQ